MRRVMAVDNAKYLRLCTSSAPMADKQMTVDTSTTSSTVYSSTAKYTGLLKLDTEYAVPPSRTRIPQMRNVASSVL